MGYAPTVVRHRGRFLFATNDPAIYASSLPLGPFEKIEDFSTVRIAKGPPLWDKMLFSDDDGRLDLYFGCSAAGGIRGMEVDAVDPMKALSEPVELLTFDLRKHPWEALGDWNRDTTKGWLEGVWMLKHKDKYYLTYAAASTEHRTYAMG